MVGDGEPARILTVCTHNRTRSVMMMALLQAGFDRRVGAGRVLVRSLGFGPEGEQPVRDAVREMSARGLDVSAHRSLSVTAERVVPADLLLTAEVRHVVDIAGVAAEVLPRTFTLPEFCSRVEREPEPGGGPLRAWVNELSARRDPAAYLSSDVPEVVDPTGSPRKQFARATLEIEAMCDAVVEAVSAAIAAASARSGRET